MTKCLFYATEAMAVTMSVVLALTGAGCGSGDHSTPPVARVALKALDSARGTVKEASRGYFQRMLITPLATQARNDSATHVASLR